MAVIPIAGAARIFVVVTIAPGVIAALAQPRNAAVLRHERPFNDRSSGVGKLQECAAVIDHCPIPQARLESGKINT